MGRGSGPVDVRGPASAAAADVLAVRRRCPSADRCPAPPAYDGPADHLVRTRSRARPARCVAGRRPAGPHRDGGVIVTGDRDRLTRWRLILGGEAAEGLGAGISLGGDDQRRDEALAALYSEGARRGGLNGSAPRVARWLGDIRGYFPSSVVRVMQADAMDRLGLHQLLMEPELMEAVQPDINLVSTLIGL